jgi:F420-dependent oxidoreductase-like protein
VKLGISLTNFSWPIPTAEIGPTVAGIARRAEDAGFDSLWTMDHFFQIRIAGEPPEAPMLEAYATLAFVAGVTNRIALGTSVTSVAYRHPGVLVKAVTSLDVLSGGRAIFGVGAGAPWNELPADVSPRDVEVHGLGIPFPPLAARFEQLEELLQIAHQMWRGDEAPFEGRHYRLGRLLNSPNTLQRPHPPIMIGGSGERKTLRLVARYGDMCNLFDLPGTGFSDDLAHKLEVLREHCRDVGRDYDEIEKTTATILDVGADRRHGIEQFVEHVEHLAAMGIDQAIVGPRGPWNQETLEAVCSVIPHVHAIPTRAVVT